MSLGAGNWLRNQPATAGWSDSTRSGADGAEDACFSRPALLDGRFVEGFDSRDIIALSRRFIAAPSQDTRKTKRISAFEPRTLLYSIECHLEIGFGPHHHHWPEPVCRGSTQDLCQLLHLDIRQATVR